MNISLIIEWILGFFLIISSIGVITFKNPVQASLSFLLTLLTLAVFYFQASAHFIGVMQIIVYAGAILVIFIFVLVLFQDAHSQIHQFAPKSSKFLLGISAIAFTLSILDLAYYFLSIKGLKLHSVAEFGTVQSLGKTLYLDFFFPFEAVTLLFLVAAVGALYIGKKEI